ncbi:ATP-grasp domain-containing protein [Flavobacterium silvaticum]|uniref:ATP-grasp domain-containing protein n=1 Tax=Flavobacterium silvaticum TaxID=1852020 RepID=A0A972FNY2_9FLAO|nr:ATP-grasp domain-containing protein [Flavobacterium silvaticum]NMH29521.1 ATP-grasp domain-containing protein [Flavobacterium silvaticum]
MEEKTVLVTGTGGNVGQGVLRNIRSLGRNIRIVGTDISAFTAGNHLCDVTYAVPYSYDPDYIPVVAEIAEKENVDLIIPTTDYEVFYLSENKNHFKAQVAASEATTAKKYLDKYLTYEYHAQHGIPFAKSWLPKDYDGSQQDIILKPREGRGSRGIVINPFHPKEFGDGYMVQPLHKGREITTAFYVTKDGELHGLFTMERELSNGATQKSKVVTEFDAEVREILLKMIAVGGLYGSLNLQSIVTEQGEIVPFEVNCRISGTNSIRHNLGFQDVKYTIQEYLYDEKPDTPNPQNGIAIRLLYDIIYPGATSESDLNNNQSGHVVY